MLAAGIREGLTSTRNDFFQAAGERCFELAVQPGLDSKQFDLHAEVVHLCSLADILSLALRKDGPWKPVEPIEVGNGSTWESDAYLDGSGAFLRRVICTSSWSEDRHFSVCRSWGSLGPVCLYDLPMKIAVCLIGAHREGRYHSFWTRGYLHPANRKLRFRKRTDSATGFKSSWISIWREDRDEIDTRTWLQGMLDDSVLQDSTVLIDLPVPTKEAKQNILDLAARRLDQIYSTETLPDQQLSTCDFPIPCIFRSPCHSNLQPSSKYGFVPCSQILALPQT